jgi:hypothetical protein
MRRLFLTHYALRISFRALASRIGQRALTQENVCMKDRSRQKKEASKATPCGLPDHLRDEWAKLSPEERLQRTLRLHRLRRELLKLRR